MRDMTKKIGVILLILILAGCSTQKVSMPPGTSITNTSAYDGPKILFLSGTIAYDSLTATYDIKIAKQQQFEGKLNLDDSYQTGELKGLNYLQVDADSTVLSQHVMENPLVQRFEYFEGGQPVTKTVYLKEAELYMRIQLNPQSTRIVFRNGKQHINTLDIH